MHTGGVGWAGADTLKRQGRRRYTVNGVKFATVKVAVATPTAAKPDQRQIAGHDGVVIYHVKPDRANGGGRAHRVHCDQPSGAAPADRANRRAVLAARRGQGEIRKIEIADRHIKADSKSDGGGTGWVGISAGDGAHRGELNLISAHIHAAANGAWLALVVGRGRTGILARVNRQRRGLEVQIAVYTRRGGHQSDEQRVSAEVADTGVAAFHDAVRNRGDGGIISNGGTTRRRVAPHEAVPQHRRATRIVKPAPKSRRIATKRNVRQQRVAGVVEHPAAPRRSRIPTNQAINQGRIALPIAHSAAIGRTIPAELGINQRRIAVLIIDSATIRRSIIVIESHIDQRRVAVAKVEHASAKGGAVDAEGDVVQGRATCIVENSPTQDCIIPCECAIPQRRTARPIKQPAPVAIIPATTGIAAANRHAIKGCPSHTRDDVVTIVGGVREIRAVVPQQVATEPRRLRRPIALAHRRFTTGKPTVDHHPVFQRKGGAWIRPWCIRPRRNPDLVIGQSDRQSRLEVREGIGPRTTVTTARRACRHVPAHPHVPEGAAKLRGGHRVAHKVSNHTSGELSRHKAKASGQQIKTVGRPAPAEITDSCIAHRQRARRKTRHAFTKSDAHRNGAIGGRVGSQRSHTHRGGDPIHRVNLATSEITIADSATAERHRRCVARHNGVIVHQIKPDRPRGPIHRIHTDEPSGTTAADGTERRATLTRRHIQLKITGIHPNDGHIKRDRKAHRGGIGRVSPSAEDRKHTGRCLVSPQIHGATDDARVAVAVGHGGDHRIIARVNGEGRGLQPIVASRCGRTGRGNGRDEQRVACANVTVPALNPTVAYKDDPGGGVVKPGAAVGCAIPPDNAVAKL